jgi:DNA-binding NarL/FixJ family response regulator
MDDFGEVICRAPERDAVLKQDGYTQHLTKIEFNGIAHDPVTVTMPSEADAGLARVAVVDSHCLTRECITNNISTLFSNIKILSFRSAPECNKRTEPLFSLIILYLHASEEQPLDIIRSLASIHAHSIIFLISDTDYQTNPDFIRAAWRLGTRGFVSAKATSMALALSAIRFVQAGGFFAPIDALLTRSPAAPEPLRSALPTMSELTGRETVVLGLLRQGKTNKDIARDLRLSSNTVKVHVHNILRKMQASNRAEAASKVSGTFAANDHAAHVL